MRRLWLLLAVIAVGLIIHRALHPVTVTSSTTSAAPHTPVLPPGVLAAGASYALALDRSGRVFGWGGLRYADSGSNLLSATRRPRLLLQGANYRRISAGVAVAYAISGDGRLWRVALDEIGDAPAEPRAVLLERRWLLAQESWGIGVGIDRDGGLFHWSDEDLAQLLIRPNQADLAERARPRALMLGMRFMDACVFNLKVYALSEDGRLWRSDDLRASSLRQGPLQGERPTLQRVAADAVLRRVHCRENGHHLLALDERGQAWTSQQATDDVQALAPIAGMTWEALAVGSLFSLGIARDGSLWGWGRNADHELGLGDDHSRDEPTLIDHSRVWVAIDATYGNGIALDDSGLLHAWGGNAFGVLGDGGVASVLDRPTPVLTDLRFGGLDAKP